MNIHYFNINSEYQSYYDIKHKHPRDYLAIWSYISAVREHTAHHLPFKDINGNQGKFTHTPMMASVISQVDKKVTHAGMMETLAIK